VSTPVPVEVSLAVGGHDVRVGTLYPSFRRGTEAATFVYGTDYLADPEAYALEPALPLTAGHLPTPVGLPLFNALRDAAPDRWGRTLIARLERIESEARGTTPRSLSEVDLLLGVRDDLRTGALRFRTETDGPFLAHEGRGVPALIDLPDLAAAVDRVESDEEDSTALRRLVGAGSSLGGARPKAHVVLRSGRAGIAKFPSRAHDTWNVMAWEKVALDLAAEAGVRVAPSELLRIAGRSVLVLERFDRTPDSRRIDYRSALTLLEARDGDTRSYLDIAEAIETQSPAATADLAELWRRIVFNVMISNTDDHLRNHGFLRAGGGWRLAPAFDLNPDPGPGSKHLSTAIDDVRTDASLELTLSVAPAFRLDRSQAEVIVSEVRSAVAEWTSVAAAHGLDRREQHRMAPAFLA
jgi:serine/threonine-protein kinase HipA